MTRELYEKYKGVLKEELILALGCTEPIAVAYTAAYARAVLGEEPERIEVLCSGNIIKNVRGVTVPNSGGMKGIEAAAALGAVGGRYADRLEVLSRVCEEDIKKAKKLVKGKCILCRHKRGVDNLYISVIVVRGEKSACVTVAGSHTGVVRIKKNENVLWENERSEKRYPENSLMNSRAFMSLKDIFLFVKEADLDELEDIFDRQIECNLKIAREGIENGYGARVGKTILECFGDDVRHRAIAYAAAGSDARMGGCALPVVINSGSGNQGMTVALPIVQYAQQKGTVRSELYRALILGNLVAIYQKSFIGKLSAYCGAVSAAAGAISGIAWLEGMGEEVIGKAIINTICTAGGMVCDGAKPSCASKIAVALEAAMLSLEMAKKGIVFSAGDGLAKEGADRTIRSVGKMARDGMADTDVEILKIMLES